MQRDYTENDGVITIEYVGAGVTADGAKDIGISELKVSKIGGFEESNSGKSCNQLVGPISCGGFRFRR